MLFREKEEYMKYGKFVKKYDLFAIFIFIALIFSIFNINVVADEKKGSQKSYFTSYLSTNDLCIYISSGFLLGFTLNAGAEFVLGQWNISNVLPIDYSLGGKFIFNGYSGHIGISPVFMIHIGFSGINLELYQGIGIGVKIPDGATFTEIAGLNWFINKNLSIIFEYAYIGFSSWGIGIMFKI